MRQFWFLALLVVFCVFVTCGQVRIVSLSPTPTEIVYSLGAGDQVLGATTFCVFPEQVIDDKKAGKVKVVGDFTHIDIPLVDSLAPDLLLTDTFFQRALAAQFRAKGYKVLHYEPRSLDDVFRSIEEIGDAIGKGTVARELVRGYRAELALIKAKVDALPKVRVYMEINHMGPWAVGRGSPLNDLIMYAGGENIFKDDTNGVFQTTNEEIVKRNPDIILSPIWVGAKIGGYDGITPLGEIYGRKGFESIRAVQTSRVLYYDSALLKHEGPRQVLAVRKLARLLHPEKFEDPPATVPWELGKIR
jgi:iron complex transport system substrate-binding protein